MTLAMQWYARQIEGYDACFCDPKLTLFFLDESHRCMERYYLYCICKSKKDYEIFVCTSSMEGYTYSKSMLDALDYVL